jgi:hypothetical protein
VRSASWISPSSRRSSRRAASAGLIDATQSACTGGSTGTPRAPAAQPLDGHSAPRGSPYGLPASQHEGVNFGRRLTLWIAPAWADQPDSTLAAHGGEKVRSLAQVAEAPPVSRNGEPYVNLSLSCGVERGRHLCQLSICHRRSWLRVRVVERDARSRPPSVHSPLKGRCHDVR